MKEISPNSSRQDSSYWLFTKQPIFLYVNKTDFYATSGRRINMRFKSRWCVLKPVSMLMHFMSVGTSFFPFFLEFYHFTSTSFCAREIWHIFRSRDQRLFIFNGTRYSQTAENISSYCFVSDLTALTEVNSLSSPCQCCSGSCERVAERLEK